MLPRTLRRFRQRLAAAAAAAVFAWLSTMLTYWNWYRFPLDFTLAALAEQLSRLLACRHLDGLMAWLRRTSAGVMT
ncbi:MAG: hypothetical protein ABI268_07715 [Rhodanobacter sp.]